MSKVFKVGLIGCSHIAETYFRAHKYFKNFKIIKCADVKEKAAKKCAKIYKIKAVSVNNLLKDKQVEIILNLTPPKVHYQIAKKSLLNGKHVYSEKPLAINLKDGKELLKLSKKKKLYLGNAPDTFLGGGNQKSKELLEGKSIGKVNLGNAIFAFPGVQSYHPDPEPWFAKKEGGPVIDMGPYYLTALVNLLGPAIEVKAASLMKGSRFRTIGIGPKKGKRIKVDCPTTYFTTIIFENGSIIRLTLSFDVIAHQRNHIELYGTKGSMIVPDPNMFGGPVSVSKELGSIWVNHSVEEKPLGKTNIENHSGRINEAAKQSNYRGIGLSEMIDAIENKREHRCNGELALHVLDIIECAMISSIYKVEVDLRTNCKKPMPFDDTEISKLLR